MKILIALAVFTWIALSMRSWAPFILSLVN